MKTKRTFIIASIIYTLLIVNCFSQSVGIGETAFTPDASAMLDVSNANKGMLIPRVALTGTTDNSTISNPAVSLLVYNTNTDNGLTEGYYYWDGTSWMRLLSGSAVTNVSGTAPIVSSGGNTPAISISEATTSTAGSMSASDKTKLDGIAAGATANVGTVTSVTSTAPISVSTGTSTPEISIAANSSSSAGVVASGSGQNAKVWKTDASGNPDWRADANSGGTVTSVSGNAPISVASGTTTPTISITSPLPIANGGTNTSTATPTSGAVAYGTGTAYGFSSAGTSQQVLVSNGTSAPSWTNHITNLVEPTADSDAATKAYVDAAGGGTYSGCYLINRPLDGLTCADGYTTLITLNSNGGWVFDASVMATDGGVIFVTLGGALLQISPVMYDARTDGYGANYSAATNTWSCGTLYGSNLGDNLVKITINGVTYSGIVYSGLAVSSCPRPPLSFSLCCK